jgi:hypothetical protein
MVQWLSSARFPLCPTKEDTMNVGDLVRNIHTMRGGSSDENGIVVGLPLQDPKHSHYDMDGMVKVMWFPKWEGVEYSTWMDVCDLEEVCK